LHQELHQSFAALTVAKASLQAADAADAELKVVEAYNRLAKVLRDMETLDLRLGHSVPSSVARWRSGPKA
jgi:hypothetical protein